MLTQPKMYIIFNNNVKNKMLSVRFVLSFSDIQYLFELQTRVFRTNCLYLSRKVYMLYVECFIYNLLKIKKLISKI